MKTEEITTSDIELALELLNQHKEEQKKKKVYEDRCKKLRRETMLGIKQVYDALKVPHKDTIIITGFQLRRTIIGGYSVILNLTNKANPIIKGDYGAGRNDSEKFRCHGIIGRQRGHMVDQDSYNKETRLHDNYWNNYTNKQTTHTFYENRIHQCPFCGHEEAQPDKYKWKELCPVQWFSRKWGLECSTEEMKKERLHDTPVKYKRCENCQDMSHKKYLADHVSRWGDEDKPKKKLFEALYPSPLEHDRDYFLDKRERKLQAKQLRIDVPVMNNDVNEYIVDYQHDYTGNVYLMTNNHTKRTKIGMTKNEPRFRESTLQSEDPDVELAFARNVLMMRDTERYLHEHFDDKRYRGEWFDLSDEEIEEAKSLIKRATKETL